MLPSGCGECTDTLPRQQRREGPGEGGRIFVAWGHRLSVKLKVESGKWERRGDPCGRPGARRTDCHSQCAHWLRNDGLFARGTVGRRDTWVPPYTALFCRGGRPCPPGSARSLWCVGEGLSYPPSCQPTGGHCRTRQSGHFLETGSLHPPLAALRRFPLPRATARVAPTEGNKKCGGYRAGQNPAPTHGRWVRGGGLLLWRGQGAGGRQ